MNMAWRISQNSLLYQKKTFKNGKEEYWIICRIYWNVKYDIKLIDLLRGKLLEVLITSSIIYIKVSIGSDRAEEKVQQKTLLGIQQKSLERDS
jgi:hypothetical protein